ncbi:unnamed protein product [Lactuca virosa]|uniref:Uncharacterized protein n=1 Tax=Lactuca virosa TaxID=75947 RepID=A0AAU9PNN5_9ASTR|nr:unnamed protein product [Lactuca virosa]
MSVLSKRTRNDGASSSAAVPIGGRRKWRRLDGLPVLPQYVDCGDCSWICEYCGAFFCCVERALNISTAAHARYTHCCRAGSAVLSAKPVGDNEGIIGHGTLSSPNLHQQPRPGDPVAHARHVPSDAGDMSAANESARTNPFNDHQAPTKHTTTKIFCNQMSSSILNEEHFCNRISTNE